MSLSEWQPWLSYTPDELNQFFRGADDGDEAKPDEAPVADEQVAEDTFTSVKPDELPEELQATYKSLQADYTRKTQTLAEQRREAEQATQFWDAIRSKDPNAIRQIADVYGQETVLDALGYALDEEEPDTPDDPLEALRQEIEGVKSQLTQKEQKAQEDALLAQIEADITKQFSGLDLEESEQELITSHALTQGYVTPEGFPDVKKAYEDFTKVLEGRQKKWVDGKRAPRSPVQGTAGSEKVDLNDEEARRGLIASMLEANSE